MLWKSMEGTSMSYNKSSPLDYPFATDFQHKNLRVPAGFQRGSYTQLPAIPPNNSPQPGPDNQLVSFNNGTSPFSRKPVGRFPSSGDLLDAEEKVRSMEMRLNVTEKSNRALLDEVLRLQNELKVTVKRNEDTLKDESMSRQQLEASLKSCNDLILQLSSRIKSTEDRLAQEQSAMTSLVHHTKGVEQAVINSQHELKSKKDTQSSKLADLENGLLETKLARDKLEKHTQELMDELRTLRTKVDIQGSDLMSVSNELKNKTKRLEDETRLQVEVLRKHGDQNSHSEHATVHLRGQVESRLSELRDVIIDLRTKQDQESSERRTLEQQLQLKINELQQGLADQSRKREEAIHSLDMLQREKEHEVETEKLRLEGKLTESVEDVNKRLLTKEMKLREELQDKFLQLEKVIQQEQKGRREYEKNARDEGDLRFNSLKKQIEDEINHLREIMKGDKNKNKETLQKLDEGLTLLEKQMSENRKQVDKVIAAEIKSRKVHETTTTEKIDGVQQKLQLATSALQQAIGGVNTQITGNNEKLKDDVRKMMADSVEGNTRTMADMDTRIANLTKKMSDLHDQINKKIKDASVELTTGLREQVESLHLWKDLMGNTVKEMQTTVQAIPNDIYAVEEKQKLLKSDLDTRVSAEADVRLKDVQTLKKDVEELKAMMNKPTKNTGPTVEEMETMATKEQLNSSVKRLAESVEVTKTVLGMKIQAEQKLRVDELKGLQAEIAKLRVEIEPFKKRNTPDGNNFVKGLDASSSVNKWAIYNVYRWLKWKSSWIKLLQSKNITDQESVFAPSPDVDLDMLNESFARPGDATPPPTLNKTPFSSQRNSPKPMSKTDTPEAENKTNTPKPESKMNTPYKHESKAHTPKPESKTNTPKPESKTNTPKPESKANTLKSESKVNTPKPESKANTPKPESKANTPKPESKVNSPKPESKTNTPKPVNNGN
ncbi:coiled-coil domain-containing protein 154 isoform X2 [Patella vulgata]|uniref:coiled-coil domain-containing protein 154 isoform X2 n=1 Tax=Patella vulgata TaxID=6465 RepID=UPI00217F4448|nr:coiled-coil domain-containing protein 154 isoform X2 [Patella vulgata]